MAFVEKFMPNPRRALRSPAWQIKIDEERGEILFQHACPYADAGSGTYDGLLLSISETRELARRLEEAAALASEATIVGAAMGGGKSGVLQSEEKKPE